MISVCVCVVTLKSEYLCKGRWVETCAGFRASEVPRRMAARLAPI